MGRGQQRQGRVWRVKRVGAGACRCHVSLLMLVGGGGGGGGGHREQLRLTAHLPPPPPNRECIT